MYSPFLFVLHATRYHDLQDLLSTPPADARRLLKAAFCRRACLKLGFNLRGDFAAIETALGPEGSGCTSVVDPAIDFARLGIPLPRSISSWGSPPAVRGEGLSGLVAARLGALLDKSLQVSAWGERPLSVAQLEYAAADAAVLLALLADLIMRGAGGRPELWPLQQGLRTEILEVEGAEPERREDERKGEGVQGGIPESSCVSDTPVTVAAQSLDACSTAQILAATLAWGQRLEPSKPSPRRSGKPPRQGSPHVSSLLSSTPPGRPALPPRIPWLHPSTISSEPRFLCDVMAQGLARQLRLWGFDADAIPTTSKDHRPAVYRAMVERADEERRVILTKDKAFVARSLSDSAYLVRSEDQWSQLREVVAVFGLPAAERGAQALLSRCVRCNGAFLEKPVGPEGLGVLAAGVPAGVLAAHDEFWVCERAVECGGVYWRGAQYSRAIERLSRELELLPGAAVRG
jgi:uncharacterized protein